MRASDSENDEKDDISWLEKGRCDNRLRRNVNENDQRRLAVTSDHIYARPADAQDEHLLQLQTQHEEDDEVDVHSFSLKNNKDAVIKDLTKKLRKLEKERDALKDLVVANVDMMNQKIQQCKRNTAMYMQLRAQNENLKAIIYKNNMEKTSKLPAIKVNLPLKTTSTVTSTTTSSNNTSSHSQVFEHRLNSNNLQCLTFNKETFVASKKSTVNENNKSCNTKQAKTLTCARTRYNVMKKSGNPHIPKTQRNNCAQSTGIGSLGQITKNNNNVSETKLKKEGRNDNNINKSTLINNYDSVTAQTRKRTTHSASSLSKLNDKTPTGKDSSQLRENSVVEQEKATMDATKKTATQTTSSHIHTNNPCQLRNNGVNGQKRMLASTIKKAAIQPTGYLFETMQLMEPVPTGTDPYDFSTEGILEQKKAKTSAIKKTATQPTGYLFERMQLLDPIPTGTDPYDFSVEDTKKAATGRKVNKPFNSGDGDFSEPVVHKSPTSSRYHPKPIMQKRKYGQNKEPVKTNLTSSKSVYDAPLAKTSKKTELASNKDTPVIKTQAETKKDPDLDIKLKPAIKTVTSNPCTDSDKDSKLKSKPAIKKVTFSSCTEMHLASRPKSNQKRLSKKKPEIKKLARPPCNDDSKDAICKHLYEVCMAESGDFFKKKGSTSQTSVDTANCDESTVKVTPMKAGDKSANTQHSNVEQTKKASTALTKKPPIPTTPKEVKSGSEKKRGRERRGNSPSVPAKKAKVMPSSKPKAVRGRPECHEKNSRSKRMTTHRRYHTLMGDQDYSWYEGTDPENKPEENDAPVANSKASSITVPNWRIKTYLPSKTNKTTEKIDSSVYEKRHKKWETLEKRQIRWDMQSLREQERKERVLRKSRNSDDDNKPKDYSIWPQALDELRAIVVSDAVHVNALSEPIPNLPPKDFKLQWVGTSKSLRGPNRSEKHK